MRKLIYLFPFAIMALSSCLKSSSDSNTPIPVPNGTFSGQFRIIHKKTSGVGYDTTKSTMVLKMSPDSGFRVLSDTTIVHAGSYGDFSLNGTYVLFVDKTYPKTGVPKKVHLNGYYVYGYDGTKFQFYTTFADTMAYQYDLVRSK